MIVILLLILFIYGIYRFTKFLLVNSLPKQLFQKTGGEYDKNTGIDGIPYKNWNQHKFR